MRHFLLILAAASMAGCASIPGGSPAASVVLSHPTYVPNNYMQNLDPVYNPTYRDGGS